MRFDPRTGLLNGTSYGLERALATIASDPEPLGVANGATQHMYIVNPLKKVGGGSAIFSTHPAIVDRFNRLRQLTGERPLDASSIGALVVPELGAEPRLDAWRRRARRAGDTTG